MKTILEGGCLCGKTRYRLTAPPTEIGDCHCVDCRRASAAPFVTWGTVVRSNLELTAGELRQVRHANRLRSFAACCGTPLFFAETADSATIDFTICSLDQPEPLAPRKAIWTEDRLAWVALEPGRPVFRQSGGSGGGEVRTGSVSEHVSGDGSAGTPRPTSGDGRSD